MPPLGRGLLFGRVLDWEGRPRAGAIVAMYDAGTGGDGEVSGCLGTEECDVEGRWITHTNAEGRQFWLVGWGAGPGNLVGIRRIGISGGERVEAEIVLDRPAVVEGRVLDSSTRQPIEGAIVNVGNSAEVFFPDSRWYPEDFERTTDIAGRFRFEEIQSIDRSIYLEDERGQPLKYFLVAKKQGYSNAAQMCPVTAGGTNTLEFLLDRDLQSTQIDVRVAGPAGPVADASVVYWIFHGNAEEGARGGWSEPFVTEASGIARVEVRRTPDMLDSLSKSQVEFEIHALAPGMSAGRTAGLESLLSQDRGSCEVLLGQGHALAGQVIDKVTRQPIAGAKVRAHSLDDPFPEFAGPPPELQERMSAVSDAGGFFRIEGLSGSDHGLSVDPDGGYWEPDELSSRVFRPGASSSIEVELEPQR